MRKLACSLKASSREAGAVRELEAPGAPERHLPALSQKRKPVHVMRLRGGRLVRVQEPSDRASEGRGCGGCADAQARTHRAPSNASKPKVCLSVRISSPPNRRPIVHHHPCAILRFPSSVNLRLAEESPSFQIEIRSEGPKFSLPASTVTFSSWRLIVQIAASVSCCRGRRRNAGGAFFESLSTSPFRLLKSRIFPNDALNVI